MTRPGPSAVAIDLSDEERVELRRWAGGAVSPVVVVRARIVLACSEGMSNAAAAVWCSTTAATVGVWRARFAQRGLAGLLDRPRSGRPTGAVVLSDGERVTLTRWARRARTAQALALRARIVLACAEPGAGNKQIAAGLGCSPATVGKWRTRFLTDRLEGLTDEDRPGRPSSVSLDQVEDVLVATLESKPRDATHWSRKSMAAKSGLSRSTIGRIWKDFGLKPHRTDTFKLSTDPLFVEKVVDVVGLYHNPPERAVVLCVDEKSQIQALDRSQPVLPMMPGMPERRSHDYLRNGITTLFAAFNIADGSVIGEVHRHHRAVEFKKFLTTIDKTVPEGLDIHMVCDNYGTHKTPAIKAWLARHPRIHLHFTPTGSSWLNQVERWFGFLTDQLIRRGVHHSVQALEHDIRAWITTWNDDPKPFVWKKTAEEILDSLARYLQRISGNTTINQLIQRTSGAGH